MSPQDLMYPEGEVDINLPYDGDMDEDIVRRAAINRLRTHEDKSRPVFSGGRILHVHADSAYPPAFLIGVADINGMDMVMDIQLDTVEQVEILEEQLEMAKKVLREQEEKRDAADAND